MSCDFVPQSQSSSFFSALLRKTLNKNKKNKMKRVKEKPNGQKKWVSRYGASVENN